MAMGAIQTGTVTLYISHGAGSYIDNRRKRRAKTDWFIVEPRDDPDRLARQVESLRRAGRTVRELTVTPYESEAV